MNIHIVEDDIAVADSLRMLLLADNHDVIVHEDAESFIAAGVPDPEDAVIIDLGLPKMSGRQILDWLNKLAARPRIVIVTGLNEKMIAGQLKDREYDALIRKPVSRDALNAIIS